MVRLRGSWLVGSWLPDASQRQLARVDRHADDGVDARGVEASISSHVVMPPAAVTRRVGGAADGHDRVHVGALHQPLVVDVGVEELAAVRLERPHGVDRGDRQQRSSSRESRRGRRGCRRRRSRARRRPRRPARVRTPTSTTPSRNSAELTITACAPAPSTSRARSTLRMPPPTRQGSRPQIVATSARVVAAPMRGVEIDQLHARKARELARSRLGIGGFDRELLALHELDDVAVLEIDRGNQHAVYR